MKGFIESWIDITPSNAHLYEVFVNWLEFLKYNSSIWEFTGLTDSILNNILKHPINQKSRVLNYNRTTLSTIAKNQSKAQLDNLRKKYTIVAQLCNSPVLTKWACLDQRIDCLQFQLSEIHHLVDMSTARLLKENNKILEIDCSQFFKSRSNPIGLLRNTKKSIFRCMKKEVPILLSSRTTELSSLKSPYAVLAMAEFLGIPPSYYREISLIAIKSRLKRNSKRLNSELFVAPNIWKTEKSNGGKDN